MTESIACDGQWQQGMDGAVICSGTLEIVSAGGAFGLPSLTYDDANEILVASIKVFVVVFIVLQLRRIIR